MNDQTRQKRAKMFTTPTIITSNDLAKRSYVTFYFNNERVREYNGNNIGKRITPNRSNSLEERNQLLNTLRYELHKALEAEISPVSKHSVKQKELPENDIKANVQDPIEPLNQEATAGLDLHTL